MNITFSACKQVQPIVNFPIINLESYNFWTKKDKIVIIMGATGTGKSRLSIDLAAHFPAEVVNSDKMQVYEGLDIVTNKVTEEECRGVPHHLLGVLDPDVDFTPFNFSYQTSIAVESIIQRDRVPIIAGGSNSYIEALVNDNAAFRSKYECCFLWVDVSLPILHSFVSERVDRMVEMGLVDEVRRMFDPTADYSRGVRRAIGVPELDSYLRSEGISDEKTRAKLLEIAIEEIKINTRKLACCQLKKIHRLRDHWSWNLHRIEATEVFLKKGREADEAWDKLVVTPSMMIVNEFLCNGARATKISPPTTALTAVPMAAVATASH